jgi:alpha-amylase/alpha-mannosidase (GH57 family)
MTQRYICIHGHFYQPPRENAWLESVELQDSAYPYHDWNTRITAECYGANALSRILDDGGRIGRMVNNYTKMSFNFGPTLLAWMAENAPDIYQTILQADARSRKRFSGHGSAIAQAYNHMILPLANRRDKYTQLLWGIEDFKHRFGRRPEGMWLPETAVDRQSLEIMAELGIRFTILSPHQAARVRAVDAPQWHDVSGGTIDPTRPYTQELASGRRIAIFFYDHHLSRAVAFERLLKNGEGFANRMLGAFSEERPHPQLVSVVTDGESYGHHHLYGDMALAYALDYIESKALARLTNYGEYLAKHPPSWEVEIVDNTSWSCTHGIQRWHSDCGCNSGQNGEWDQVWREPLRNAMDWLRDTLAPPFLESAEQYLKDPWQARNAYVDVVIDRSPEKVEQFFTRHSVAPLTPANRITILKLMEMQRHLMLMYTSCGWFFDELSGIETVQAIQYAGRAIQLYNDIFNTDIEPRFLERLERAKSNIVYHRDGRRIFEKFVKPAMVDLRKVAAHYAISALFEEYPQRATIFCYQAFRRDFHSAEAGKAKLAVGQVEIVSNITQESAGFYFGVMHFGDHNLACGIREYMDGKSYQRLLKKIFASFEKADFPEVLRIQDHYFESSRYSLKSLFRDEQRKILDMILKATETDAQSAYKHIFEHHVPLMRFLKDTHSPPPRALAAAAEIVVNSELCREFGDDDLDVDTIRNLLEEADLAGIPLDADTLEYTLRKNLEQMAEKFRSSPQQHDLLEKMVAGIELVYALPFDVNLRKVQDLHYEVIQSTYPQFKQKAQQGDRPAGRWVADFKRLSDKLLILLE